MTRIIDIEPKDINVGARVNKHLVDLLKEGDIPISEVFKSALVFFLTLPDSEKVEFIAKYNILNLTSGDIKYPELLWTELKRKYGREE